MQTYKTSFELRVLQTLVFLTFTEALNDILTVKIIEQNALGAFIIRYRFISFSNLNSILDTSLR